MASGDSVLIKIIGDDSGFKKVLSGVTKGVAAAGAALVTATGYAVNFANNVKKASNDFQAATGIAGEAAQGFEDAMLRIYNNNFGESLEDISDAMATVAQTTQEMDPSKIEGMTQNALALRDTFGFDIQEQIRAANMLMDQFGVTGEEAFNLIAQGAQGGLDKNGDLLDSINEYSVHFKSLGLDVEDMFNSLQNGAAAGTFSVDKLGDTIKEFGIRAKDGSDSTKEAFKTLGLDVDATSAAFAAGGDKAEQAFQNVINSLFNMQDPLAQNTVGVSLFGTMWEDLGVEGVKALTNLNGGISTAKDALAQINEIKYDDFGSAISGLGRILQTSFVLPIGEQVLPILSDFATELTAGAVAANGNMTLLAESFSTAFSGLISNFLTFLPQITGFAGQIVFSLINGIVAAIPSITQSANQILLALINGLIVSLPMLADAALQLILALANGIGQALPQLIPKITEMVAAIVQTLVNNIPMIVEAALQLILGFADGLLAAIPVLIEALPEIITSLVDGLLDAVPQLIEAGIELLTSLVKDIPTIISTVIAAIPEIISGIMNSIIDNIPQIVQAGVDLLTSLIDDLPTIISTIITAGPTIILSFISALAENTPKLVEMGITLFTSLIKNMPAIIKGILVAIPQIIDSIVSSIKSLLWKIVDVGGDIVKGIWEGITKSWNWLVGKIKEWCNNILDAIKAVFGINSPSKVMRDEVGKMITKGIAVGIDDGKTEVQKAMDEMNAELLDSEKRYNEESERLKESKNETDQAYLEELKAVAEKERKIYDALQKDIENDKNEIVNHFQEMADSAFDSIEEIESAQESLASKLKETGNATYETITTVIGDDETSYTRLADMSADNSLLEKYNNALDALFQKRGELPEDVMQSLAEMGAEEGLAYANALLFASDAEYSKYIQDLQEKQRLAEEIGKKVYASQTDELMAEFEKEWGKVPEDFFAIGEDSAEQYGEGFMAQLKNVFERVRTEIANSMSGLQPNMQFATAAVGTGTSNTYTDNRSTVIYANNTSPHAIIEAQKQNEIYQQHTKKWE